MSVQLELQLISVISMRLYSEASIAENPLLAVGVLHGYHVYSSYYLLSVFILKLCIRYGVIDFHFNHPLMSERVLDISLSIAIIIILSRA